jgi:hypothetical protein
MPPKQRIGRHTGGHLAQGTPTQPVRSRRQSSPAVIGETQPPPTQLPAQEAVFFDQVRDRLSFAALQPAGQDQQQHLGEPQGRSRAAAYITAGGFGP